MEKPVISTLARKKTVSALLFIINSLLIGNSFAQPSITWQALYNGPNSRDDEAYAICNADGDNFYIGGYSLFPTGAARRPYVIKINQYGDSLWTRVVPINGGGGIVNALLATADGGCVATGEKLNTKWLFRLDKNGNTVWTYTYGGNVIYYDLKRAVNGDYICAGIYQNGGASLRIDTLGNVKYDKLYLGHFFYSHSIQPTSDNGCLVGGDYGNSEQAIIAKLDSNGNMTDTRYFKINNQRTWAFTLEKDSNGYYILGGNFENVNKTIPYFIKLDFNLNPLDSHIFTQVRDEISHAMKVLPNGMYGWSFYDQRGNPDSSFNRFITTNTNGLILREKIKYTRHHEEFYEIKPVMNGDIIFIGTAEYYIFPNSRLHDFYVLRTDSLLNFPPNIIGTQQNYTLVPQNFKLYQNYPNPFNPATTIKYDIPKDAFVTVKVYDILGREVFSQNEFRTAGSYEVRFDGSNYASGMYFYQIEAGNFKDTKKMVLIK